MNFLRKNAIILSDCGNITKVLTYEDVERFRGVISEFLFKYIQEKNVCVGLRMAHNIYIPSTILSLQDLQHAFMFLPENSESEDSLEKLGISWVLSFKKSKNFVAELKLNDEKVFLECYDSISCKNYENIYYIIKTSGTTGLNKFVKVQKFCIESNVTSLSRIFNITENDTIYFGTPLSFDPSMIELLLALKNKACLLITTLKNRINPSLLYKTLFDPDNGITFLQIVPSLFNRWSQEQISSILNIPLLKILAFGGENFPSSILNYEKSSNLKIFNLYGITEVSCWASAYEIHSNEDIVPVGDALDHTLIEMRDDLGNKINEGEGEIYIGSNSRICLVDDEENLNIPVFRATGDIGVSTKNKILYKGRKNDVFKRFGHKIHLSKIENMVQKETGLENKCVWYKKESKLLLFLIMDQYDNETKDKIVDKIRIKLLHTLPQHYFPDYIDIIRKCPVTIHGKTDKTTLEQIYLEQDKKDKSHNCCDHFRSLICKYFGFGQCQFEDLLNLKIFDIGGNSILAIQLINELSETIGDLTPEFLTSLFEKDLKSCLHCLKSLGKKTKSPLPHEQYTSTKKIKTNKVELKIAWLYNLQACVDSSPLLLQYRNRTIVAVGSFSHIFATVDGGTGAEISKFVLPDVIESTPCLSPCRNYIYTGCFDGKMYCLDWTQNSIKWTYCTGDRIKCEAIICQNLTAIAFGSYDKYVHCINIEKGTLIWKTYTEESLISSPLLNDGRIFISTICGTFFCLCENDGSVIWIFKSNNPVFGSPCFINNTIIWPQVQKKIVALTVDGKIKWQLDCGGQMFCSLLQYRDSIIFGCHDFNLYIVNITDTPLVTNVVNLEGKISSTPCIGKLREEDCIIAATDCGKVNYINFEGVVMAIKKLPNQIFSSPKFLEGKTYVGCRDNNLYCISE